MPGPLILELATNMIRGGGNGVHFSRVYLATAAAKTMFPVVAATPG
jgi:hypothetical protein